MIGPTVKDQSRVDVTCIRCLLGRHPSFADADALWKVRTLAQQLDLDLRSVAVNGSAVNYLAKHAADIQLVVVGCGDRSDMGDLLGPTGSATLHDTDCSLLICDRHQRL